MPIAAEGGLLGLALGQCVTLGVLLFESLRSLPDVVKEGERLGGALRESGARLAELRGSVDALERQCTSLLWGVMSVQAVATCVFEIAARPYLRLLGLPPEAAMEFRVSLVGAGARGVMLLGMILLYYFDRRRDAFVSTLVLGIGVVAATAGACALGLPPSVGTVVAATAAAAVTWTRVRQSARESLEDALLDQPLGREVGARAMR